MFIILLLACEQALQGALGGGGGGWEKEREIATTSLD